MSAVQYDPFSGDEVVAPLLGNNGGFPVTGGPATGNTGVITANQFVARSVLPPTIAGASGVTATLTTNSQDGAGIINLSIPGSVTGTLCTVTFNAPFAATPTVVLSAASAQAAVAVADNGITTVATPTTFAIRADLATTGVNISFSYICFGRSSSLQPASVFQTVDGAVVARNFIGVNATPPLAATGPALGVGSSVSFLSGSTDTAGTIEVIALGTSTPGNPVANVAIVALNNVFVNPPSVVIFPANANAASADTIFVATFTTGWVLRIGTTALTTNRNYQWNYIVMGRTA